LTLDSQSIFLDRLLRSAFHARMRSRKVVSSAIRSPRHCFSSVLSSHSAMFSQLPCLGVCTTSIFSISRRAAELADGQRPKSRAGACLVVGLWLAAGVLLIWWLLPLL
jgi:hypothetical protein